LELRALEGLWRPVLVRDAERMNVEAQNALLKTLEEPRPGTLVVLIVERTEALLPTILSRVVRVRFAALSPDIVRALLAEQGLEPSLAERLARAARGSPGRALELARTGGLEQRELLLEVISGGLAPATAANAILLLEGEFEGRTPAAQARARMRALLDLAAELAADWVRLALGASSDGLAHGEELSRLGAGQAGSPAGLALARRWRLALAERRTELEHNVSSELVLDRACMDLAPDPALGWNSRRALLAPDLA
jgi:hypothetical protein